MTQDLLTFNGINGATGGYLLPAATPEQISASLQRKDFVAEIRKWLRRFTALTSKIILRGVAYEAAPALDCSDLAESGWGAVFGPNISPSVKEALGELLHYRRRQATRRCERFRTFTYRTGETRRDFLARQGVGYELEPDKVPYYLLLVGGPDSIPYRFQQQLDVQYAVGRLSFETVEEYANYARSVVEADRERRAVQAETSTRGAGAARAVFFGVRNPDDEATAMSAGHLVEPLAETLANHPGWEVDLILEERATKTRLASLLGGDQTPNLLFSASHGMGFPSGDKKQRPHQGAFLCQDWPGPRAWRQPIPTDHYFAAEDIASDVRLGRLICFHFGCYGGGTPQLESFAHRLGHAPEVIAPHSFVAGLPQRLLGHPRGGALAVIAHVDRSWGFSFIWPEVGEQLMTFERTLRSLMDGETVGLAMDPFNRRYAHLSSDLSRELEDVVHGRRSADDRKLVELWTATNDARSYVVLGDPAVRLPINGPPHS